jgi:neopullulanase
MMQYIPVKGVDTYARYDEKQTILCILNADTTATHIDFTDFSERTSGFEQAHDIMTSLNYSLTETMSLPPRTTRILELKKRPTANKVVH